MGDEVKGKTIGLGGDGRYYNKEASQIILKLAAGNGVKKASCCLALLPLAAKCGLIDTASEGSRHDEVLMFVNDESQPTLHQRKGPRPTLCKYLYAGDRGPGRNHGNPSHVCPHSAAPHLW